MTTPGVKNGMATAGMICGIVGIVLCWFPFVGVIAGLLGVIFGAIGMARAGRLGGIGRGAGIAGLVTGILSLLLLPIMAAIAIPAFLDYQQKAKKPQSQLYLKRLESALKVYYMERAELPPSATEMPGRAEDACMESTRKHPTKTMAQWQSAGWTAFDFAIDEPTFYSFKWTRESATHGVLESRADLDCDMTIAVQRVDVTLEQGNIVTTWGPTPQD